MVEAEWPARLEVKNSGTVRVSIVSISNGYILTQVEVQGNKALASTPVPVGTPNQGLAAAFGNEYQAYAIAHIAGASFHIELASPEEPQSLNQSRLDWIWNITADNPGLQSLDVSIEVEWRHVGHTEEPLIRQIWHNHFQVDVFQPLITTGQVSAFSLVSAFIGSGLSIPWIYETLKKRKPKPRRKEKTKQ